MRVFLVGYMGVGKTTVGKALASRLGLDFFDLDALVVAHEKMDITALFDNHGEAHFRKIESWCLAEILQKQNYVLSLGGGTPVHGDNMDRILDSGVVVHLRLPPGALIERLRKGKDSRPLLADLKDENFGQFVRDHLSERLPHYERAHLEFNVFNADANRLNDLAKRVGERYPTR